MPETLPNFRDLAESTASGGVSLQANRLFRSALPAPDDVIPDEVRWPPGTVLDLRSAPEIAGPHPLHPIAGRVVNVPILSSLRPERGWAATLVELYDRVIDEAPHHLIDAVHHAADSDGPVLVHCAAGKDRTGIVVALLLKLLDVDSGAVVDDYLLTEQHRDAIDRRLRRDPQHGPVPASFFETPVAAIERVLTRWDRTPGGVRGWFLAAGGDPVRLERWRATALRTGDEPDPADALRAVGQTGGPHGN